MSRSVWKPLYRDANFERFMVKNSEGGPTFSSRSIVLTEDFVGQNLLVHNGRRFIEFNVEPEHLGRRVGEFVYTHVKPKMIRKKNVNKKW